MPSYSAIWARLAERALAQATINIQSFMQMAVDAGMTEEALMERLEDDLDNDGPLFGSFMRSITGAAVKSVGEATRQGELIGALRHDPYFDRVLEMVENDMPGSVVEAIDSADPDLAASIEAAVEEDLDFVSVANFKNTCHECLPLHGQRLTMREWKARGLWPTQRHDGWKSDCQCRMLPPHISGGGDSLRAPLRRVPMQSATGKKGLKKTVRAVTQRDIEKAIEARNEAMQSERGRRTLRLLGQAKASEDE